MSTKQVQDGNEIEVLPWEQQPNESDAAFEGFTYYRDSLVSLREVDAQHYPTSKLSTLGRWSVTFSWVSRRKAYRNHLDEARRDRHLAKIEAAEDKLSDAVDGILDAAIKKALTGDPRATKDLLDRAGMTRKKADGNSNGDPILNIDFGDMTLDEMMKFARELNH